MLKRIVCSVYCLALLSLGACSSVERNTAGYNDSSIAEAYKPAGADASGRL